MDFAIKNKEGRPLSGFYPNDLPVNSKGNFSVAPILAFHRSAPRLFSSLEQASRYAHYIKDEILDEHNRERYEEAMPGSTDKMLRFLDTLKITEF